MRAIPVIEGSTLDLLNACPGDAESLLATARRVYTAMGVSVGDKASRAWLRRMDNPYLAEMDALAERLGHPGLHLLNLSYEWGCTTGVAHGRLLRTLDWPFEGLGRHVAVLKTSGPAGPYWSVTWPGFAGVLTAQAPGRFAVAINQAKAFHGRLTGLLEWPFNRWRTLRSRELPPAHLLRRVCDEAPDYDSAIAMLSEAPLCLPVFFSIAAPDGRGAVIEREPGRAHIHPAPAACANHWRYPGLKGATPRLACRIDAASPYGSGSHARFGAISRYLEREEDEGFGWLVPPVLCRLTRLACVMDVARGRMSVLGLEGGNPATEILHVSPLLGVAQPR